MIVFRSFITTQDPRLSFIFWKMSLIDSLKRRVGRTARQPRDSNNVDCELQYGQAIPRSKHVLTAIDEIGNFDEWTKLLRAAASTREKFLRFAASQPTESNLLRFASNNSGLQEQDAIDRLKKAGKNILSTKKPLAWWQILLKCVPTAFNVLLALIAVISIATPPPTWSTFIILVVMIVVSSFVQFWQEYRGKVAVIRLQASVTEEITVRRQELSKSFNRTIRVEDIVPGDIIQLNPGDCVPADCLILESFRLSISQSSLTGESEPQSKSNKLGVEKAELALFDFDNLAFMGTSVISGSATALVLATSDNSFIASIMKELNKAIPISAFERGICHVTYMLAAFMFVMVGIVLVIQGLRTKNWRDATLFSISVAVGIVPEMLPAIVNTNLARGAFMLAKQKAIVKRLSAVQNLGGMTVLCSDKTGTLTQDEITLCHHQDCEGNESDEVLRLAYTNATYQSGTKNSIDAAIIKKAGASEFKPVVLGSRVAEIPFDFEKRRSSVVARDDQGNVTLICKGAFEEVLASSGSVRIDGVEHALTTANKQSIFQKAHAKNDDGFRVLALAVRKLNSDDLDEDERLRDLESDMTLLGLLTFMDPPKEDAAASIAALQNLGVEIKVLTGDNLRVASKVCRTLNILRDNAALEDGLTTITGPELTRLSDDEFHERVRDCTIFAKLTPAQKGEVVLSLKQHSGQAVGMLGDGINDCIALRSADVGISVDTAASVAKDCADVILATKSLSIVVDGVRTGRITHGNSIKYIKMVASSNFGNVFSVMVASAWLPYEPMTALQILMQNLLYDISQIALPWDRMDEEYLTMPKQWNTWDLLRFVVVLGPTSSTIDMCTFCLDWFLYGIRTENSPLVPRAHSHWFLEGLLTQTLIVHLLRTAKVPFFQSWASWPLLVSTSIIMTVGVVIPYFRPVAKVLDLVPPATSFLGFLVAELLLYCVEVQLIKVAYKRLFKTWL